MASKIKVFALGGLGEVGKNMYVLASDAEIIIVDAGILLSSNYGVGSVIPDYTYLKQNEGKIKGLFITHGHEDHIGGIPFLLEEVKIPYIYAAGIAVDLIKSKIKKISSVRIEEYQADSVYAFNDFTVSFYRTNHSIPDSFGIAIKTSYGYVLHTGDFKFDFTPIAYPTEYYKITDYGRKGIVLLLSESTNAGIESPSPSERKISQNLKNIFAKIKGRIIIATFASNVFRLEQMIKASIENNRKIIVFGKSMEKAINFGKDLSYIKVPRGTLLNEEDLSATARNKVTILCTGAQGEPLAALSRIAEGTHRTIKIIPGDTIIFSSSVIPGNQENINHIINMLYQKGAEVVINNPVIDTHTTGHATNGELQLMLNLTRPKYFMPIHGEYSMLKKHVDLAVQTGIKRQNCFILKCGEILEIGKTGVKKKGFVPTGNIYLDRNGSKIDNTIYYERRLLADDGFVACIMIVKGGKLIKPPIIKHKGFIYGQNITGIINSVRNKANNTYYQYSNEYQTIDLFAFKKYLTDVLTSHIFNLTEKKPVIFPVIIDLNKNLPT